jgi:hypothetical protein
MQGDEEDVKYFKDLYEEKIKGSFKINVRWKHNIISNS